MMGRCVVVAYLFSYVVLGCVLLVGCCWLLFVRCYVFIFRRSFFVVRWFIVLLVGYCFCLSFVVVYLEF